MIEYFSSTMWIWRRPWYGDVRQNADADEFEQFQFSTNSSNLNAYTFLILNLCIRRPFLISMVSFKKSSTMARRECEGTGRAPKS